MKPHSSGMTNATAQLCKPIESCNIQLSKTCFEMSVALNIQILHAFVWDQVERFKYSFVAYLNLCCCCLIVGFSSNFELSKLASPLSKIGSKFHPLHRHRHPKYLHCQTSPNLQLERLCFSSFEASLQTIAAVSSTAARQ